MIKWSFYCPHPTEPLHPVWKRSNHLKGRKMHSVAASCRARDCHSSAPPVAPFVDYCASASDEACRDAYRWRGPRPQVSPASHITGEGVFSRALGAPMTVDWTALGLECDQVIAAGRSARALAVRPEAPTAA